MERRSFYLKTAVCFRRWSRKAYAIFASLGVCVVIGHLDIRVADCSLSKQKGKSSALSDVKEGCIPDDMERESDTGPFPTFLFGGINDEQQSFSLLIENPISSTDSFAILRI